MGSREVLSGVLGNWKGKRLFLGLTDNKWQFVLGDIFHSLITFLLGIRCIVRIVKYEKIIITA